MASGAQTERAHVTLKGLRAHGGISARGGADSARERLPAHNERVRTPSTANTPQSCARVLPIGENLGPAAVPPAASAPSSTAQPPSDSNGAEPADGDITSRFNQLTNRLAERVTHFLGSVTSPRSLPTLHEVDVEELHERAVADAPSTTTTELPLAPSLSVTAAQTSSPAVADLLPAPVGPPPAVIDASPAGALASPQPSASDCHADSSNARPAAVLAPAPAPAPALVPATAPAPVPAPAARGAHFANLGASMPERQARGLAPAQGGGKKPALSRALSCPFFGSQDAAAQAEASILPGLRKEQAAVQRKRSILDRFPGPFFGSQDGAQAKESILPGLRKEQAPVQRKKSIFDSFTSVKALASTGPTALEKERTKERSRRQARIQQTVSEVVTLIQRQSYRVIKTTVIIGGGLTGAGVLLLLTDRVVGGPWFSMTVDGSQRSSPPFLYFAGTALFLSGLYLSAVWIRHTHRIAALVLPVFLVFISVLSVLAHSLGLAWMADCTYSGCAARAGSMWAAIGIGAVSALGACCLLQCRVEAIVSDHAPLCARWSGQPEKQKDESCRDDEPQSPTKQATTGASGLPQSGPPRPLRRTRSCASLGSRGSRASSFASRDHRSVVFVSELRHSTKRALEIAWRGIQIALFALAAQQTALAVALTSVHAQTNGTSDQAGALEQDERALQVGRLSVAAIAVLLAAFSFSRGRAWVQRQLQHASMIGVASKVRWVAQLCEVAASGNRSGLSSTDIISEASRIFCAVEYDALLKHYQTRHGTIGNSDDVSIFAESGPLILPASATEHPEAFIANRQRNIELARPTPLGGADCFVCHCHRDKPSAKEHALREFARTILQDQALPLTCWIDKFCLGPFQDPEVFLACLPLFVMSCKHFVILAGPHWHNSLWAIFELFIFCEMGGRLEDIYLYPLPDDRSLRLYPLPDDRSAQARQAATKPRTTAARHSQAAGRLKVGLTKALNLTRTTTTRDNTPPRAERKLSGSLGDSSMLDASKAMFGANKAMFDANKAKCDDDGARKVLLNVIENSFGIPAFNRRVREILGDVKVQERANAPFETLECEFFFVPADKIREMDKMLRFQEIPEEWFEKRRIKLREVLQSAYVEQWLAISQ